MQNNKFNFTKAKISSLPPAPKGKYHSYYDTDVSGLMVLVTGNGVKTFYVYKKVQKRPERIKVGRFPDLSIEQARNRAKVILSEIAQEINPAENKRIIRAEMTLGNLFILYMKKHGRYKKSGTNDRYLYGKYLSPWEYKKISEIRKVDVKDLHNDIGKANEHPHQANRMRALLHTMFEFALERGFEGINPCRGIKKFPERKRDRFIQRDELPQFFDVVLNDPHPIIRDFILVALFTGARSGNVQAMKWDEIDWNNAVWKIPETKPGKPHAIPLVPFLVELLKERRVNVPGEWVFPSEVIDSHIQVPKVQWLRICKQAKIEYLRIHDLRRTLGSWMAITGASELIISGALGHKIDSSSVTAIYARLDIAPIREAMEKAVQEMLIHGGVIKPDDNGQEQN